MNMHGFQGENKTAVVSIWISKNDSVQNIIFGFRSKLEIGKIKSRVGKWFCRNEIRKWFHKIKYHKKFLSKGEIQALKLSNEKRTPAQRVKGGEIEIRGTKWGARKRRVCSSDYNFGGSLLNINLSELDFTQCFPCFNSRKYFFVFGDIAGPPKAISLLRPPPSKSDIAGPPKAILPPPLKFSFFEK